MRVYIAAPYTKGDQVLNVRAAIVVADSVLAAGHTPFLPHLSHLWHLVSPKPWAEWLRLDLEWMKCCDAVIRVAGESRGAEVEVTEASKMGLPVFYSVEMWKKWVVGE